MGRYYAMDRDNRWDRVEKAYRALRFGEGKQAKCGACAIQASYDEGVTDEFVVPTVVAKDGEAVGKIQDKDSRPCKRDDTRILRQRVYRI